MTRKRVSFSPLPSQADNVAVLGGLVCDKRATLGPTAIVDFRDLPRFQLLARDFVAALDEYAQPGVIVWAGGIKLYGHSIRIFLDYCETIGVDDGLRMNAIGQEFLLGFRSHIRIHFSGKKSDYRRRIFGNLGRILKAGQGLGLVSPDLQVPRNFPKIRDNDVTQPYSAGEALDIEDACRSHIRELLARLDKGQSLLSQGRDPRGPAKRDSVTGRVLSLSPEQRPWNQLPNLLWYVVNVMDGRFVKYAGLGGKGLSSFNNATNGAFKGPYRKLDVYSHLYPLAEDLIPFINLLAKTTGRNESSIFNLSRDCLQEVDGRFLLWYRKERGSQRLYRKFIENDGPYSPVALIKTLQRITQPLVKLASPEHQSSLFLGFTPHGGGRDTIKPLDPGYVKYQMNRLGGWCERNQLLTENGLPLKISLRRLRVYYLTRRYRQHGQLGKVSRDAAHALSKTTVGYVNNDATKNVHEQATEDGIKAALRAARPTVVVEHSVQEAAKVLGSSEGVAKSVLLGEQDVFFASCRDYYNRPGGTPASACDRPWACFECSNSIITRHVLPRVIAFRNFMAQQKFELAGQDWSEKFGPVWEVVTKTILPRFSQEAISEAERYAASEKLYIPLALKA